MSDSNVVPSYINIPHGGIAVSALILWFIPDTPQITFAVPTLVLGALMAFFLPGYVVLSLLRPHSQINNHEHIIFSFPLTMVLLPILLITLRVASISITVSSLQGAVAIFLISMAALSSYLPTSHALRSIISKQKRDITGLAVLSIGLITVHVSSPARYSTIPAGWLATNSYVHTIVALQGNFLMRGMVETTIFSTTIYNYFSNTAYIYNNIMVFGLMGLNISENLLIVSKYFPIYGAVIFPLVGASLAYHLGDGLTRRSLLLIFVFLSLGSFRYLRPPLASPHVMTLVLVTAIIYTYLRPRSQLTDILFFAFSLITPFYNQTVALVLGISFGVVLLLSPLLKNSIDFRPVAYILIFAVYLLFHATIMFKELTLSFVTLVQNFGMSVGASAGRGAISLTVPHLARYANFGLLVSVLGIFILWSFADTKRRRSPELALIVGVGVSGVLLLGWQGLKGIPRMTALGMPFIAVAYSRLTASSNQQWLRQVVHVVAVLAIVSASIAYLFGVVPPMYLTHDEAQAVQWYASQPSSGQIVTDFRVAGGMIIFKEYNVTGIAGYRTNAVKNYNTIYRSGNATATCRLLQSEYDASHILISKKMKNQGVWTYTTTFRPMTQSAIKKYHSSMFTHVYDSEGTKIYRINC